MLTNIKSLYILKHKIFTYLGDAIKLKLSKYNKTLQKHLNLSIINYIIYSKNTSNMKSLPKQKEKNMIVILIN